MKKSLVDLITNTLTVRYTLPTKQIDKACLTSNDKIDYCYEANELENLAKIIYNGILYYSYDEYQLDGGNHERMFLNAFRKKFKYNESATDTAKRSLGIYGESLLYCLLKIFFNADTLISRGYFYDIQKKAEVTGYDAFHLIQSDNNLELWFGETKFYKDGISATESALDKINKAISDDYLETNFTAILQHKGNIQDKESTLYKILDKWDKCIINSLTDELNDNNISLVYPILITYNARNDYNNSVESIVNHINTKYADIVFPDINIEYSLFFILLPIDCVDTTKRKVIEWIDNNEPIM